MTEATAYETDFHDWVMGNARLLLLDADNLTKVYVKAVRDAIIETDLERHLFPVVCPYHLEQILDEDWLPNR